MACLRSLERDDFRFARHHHTLGSCWSMLFSEKRYTLFGIMLYRHFPFGQGLICARRLREVRFSASFPGGVPVARSDPVRVRSSAHIEASETTTIMPCLRKLRVPSMTLSPDCACELPEVPSGPMSLRAGLDPRGRR